MLNPKLILAILAVSIIALAAEVIPQYPSIEPLAAGDRPTMYLGCYPNACIGTLHPTHWPFGGTPPVAIVASGSPAYGDYYNFTRQLMYLLGTTNPYASPRENWRKLFPRNATNAIRVGFTSFGEFVAMLSDGTAGGISMAFYNRPDMFARYEMWATNNIPYIRPADWINGWTLSVNITGADGRHFVMIQLFAVYSNRTHAGGGRGVVIYYNATGIPTKWPDASKWMWRPLSSTPLEIIYDSPRLLVARGSAFYTTDLGFLSPELKGFIFTAYVNYTFIFPKAYPYAIVYYNYTVRLFPASKLSPMGAVIRDVAFTIRYELDQLNARTFAATANITMFGVTLGGIRGNLTLATPTAPYNNVTFFSLILPGTSEYTVYNLTHFVPYAINNYSIVLPTGSRKTTAANVIPFVIHQNKTSPRITVNIGEEGVIRGGFMFVYGLTKNATAWTAPGTTDPDEYIRRLLYYTIFYIDSTALLNYYTVIPSRGHIADVMGAAFVNVYYNGTPALDVAPLAYGTVDPTTMGSFVNLPNMGGVPVLLGKLSASFPWFVDTYSRAGFKSWLFTNATSRYAMVAGPNLIVTVGGPTPNLVTRYAQDFSWWSPFVASYSGDVFNPYGTYIANSRYAGRPILVAWNDVYQPTVTTTWPPAPNQRGYGVVSVSVDPNGTVILQVWGANAQDTYWTAMAFLGAYFNSLRIYNINRPGTYLVEIVYGNVTLPAWYRIWEVTPYSFRSLVLPFIGSGGPFGALPNPGYLLPT